jgi:hypothetical protein
MTRLRCVHSAYGYGTYASVDAFRDMARAAFGSAPDLQKQLDGSWALMPTKKKPGPVVVLAPVNDKEKT